MHSCDLIALLQVLYVCAGRAARARGAVPRASIGMRQFSAPARESCDTPGCSLLYGHAGVHFFARNRRPPDVLDPAAQPAGPSVRQPVTAARLAASTHMIHPLPPRLLSSGHVTLSASFLVHSQVR